MNNIRILIAEDRPSLAEGYLEALRTGGSAADAIVVSDGIEGLVSALEAERTDLVIAGYGFAGLRPSEFIKPILERDVHVIVVADQLDAEAAADVFRHGASDLILGEDLSALGAAIKRTLKLARTRAQQDDETKELRDGEERLRLALAAARMGVWEWDLRTDDIFWSPECSAMLGFEIAAAKSLDLRNRILPEDRPAVEENYRRAIEKGTAYVNLFRIKRKQCGSIVWIRENGRVVLDDTDATPRKIVGTLRDVTTEQTAIQAVVEAEEQYRVIAESSVDGVISIDEASSISFVNPSIERIFGYEAAELIGKPLTVLMPERFRELHLAGLQRYLASGTKALDWRGTELTGLTKDGREITVQCSFGEHFIGGRRTFTGYLRDVTIERAAVDRLRRSEMEFRALVQATSKYVWKLDERGVMISDPATWIELTGQTAEQMDNLGWLAAIHPDDRDRARENLERMQLETAPSRADLRILRADGTYGHYVARLAPVRENDQLRWICALTDVTKRREAEAALAASEMRLMDLINTVDGIVWEVDLETFNFTFVSRKAEEILGYPVEDWFAKDFWAEHIYEEDRDWAIDYCVSSSKLGLPHTFEYRMVAADGRRVWLRDIVNVVDQGGRKLLRGIMVDVTAEKKRSASLLRQAMVIEQASDAILTWDLEHGIVEWNKGCEKLYGFSRDEVHGKFPYDVLEGVFPDGLDAFRSELRERGAWSGEIIQTRKNKTKVVVVGNLQLLSHEGRNLVLQTNRDITEKLAAENALRDSEEQLRQVQKLESIGTLAGGMAHDFNNMLTAINGYSDLILRKLGSDDPIRSNVEEIRKAGERSSELTKQLLAFSRRQIMQPRVIDLNEVVEDILSMLRRLIDEDIEINTELAPKLWKVEADPGQISQVLVNLAVNARDAMPHGGKLTIATRNLPNRAGIESAAGSRNHVQLTISDTGSGMDEETRTRAFEPFFTTKPIGHGTGLGLSTVFGIINQSGGQVSLNSEEGAGTSIEILMPASADGFAASFDDATQTGLPIGAETVLVVEDEMAVRKLAVEILESCGYSVLEAGTGNEALRLLGESSRSIDLLITDVVMPEMDGRNLALLVSKDFPSVDLLFTSGYTDDAAMRDTLVDPRENFLQKPFTFTSLATKVRSILDARNAH